MNPSTTDPVDTQAVAAATAALRAGGVIAYPTEAVWGLGCDPFSEPAVLRVLQLKQRDRSTGLILIGSGFDQLQPLIGPVPRARMTRMRETWPGPVTWVVPVTGEVPPWICGRHHSVALRVTDHPVARALCEAFEGPLVSTSANVTGGVPARSENEARAMFPEGIDAWVPGETGDAAGPTEIRDALSGEVLRASS